MKDKFKALILCGGESSRIKYNKALLLKDSIPLYVWWSRLFNHLDIPSFISCRKDQVQEYPNVKCICDIEKSEGPLSGILSAFQFDSSCSWIIVACDLVYMEEKDIQQLILSDSDEYDFIAYNNPEQDLPYSLCTIYKPSIYDCIRKEYAKGRKSPLKVLQQSFGKSIHAESNMLLIGINTPDELSSWQAGVNP